jgi:BolA protein
MVVTAVLMAETFYDRSHNDVISYWTPKMSDRRANIEAKLRDELDAIEIEVIDESHLHAGHVGAREGGGHFRVAIVSKHFAGLGRIAAQRLVYKVLESEMKSEIHALSITASAPPDKA